MQLQEELAKEEAEEQQKEALQTQVAQVPTRSISSCLKHSVGILGFICFGTPMVEVVSFKPVESIVFDSFACSR